MNSAEQRALDRYWMAETRDQERVAHRDLLLAGGPDGYASPGIRTFCARMLRKLAFLIENARE